ncbi:substrate-binding periplasmic protein [Planctobacterium marinum]|uniref:Solute-binding protein family 3/N-terminal domain-containing protein n=1 Tax=Planctobacterium marinum TaxID=1631968 RepID=A0AA48HW94_9ALTE|nr:hypothetical protein MACH26_25390 [Planctobacterium marinum]
MATVNAAIAKTSIPVVTENSYFPYSYVKDDKVAGIYVDIVSELNQLMPDFEITLKPMSWRQGLQQVKTGKSPAILGTYYRGQDRKFVYPYSQTFAYERVVVICHPESNIKKGAKWPSDFAGKLITNVDGYDGWLDYKTRDKSITSIANFLEVPSVSVAWNMVNKNLVDCTLFEQQIWTIKQDTDPRASNLVKATNVTTEGVHVGFSNAANIAENWPNLPIFRRQLDDAIYVYKKRRNVHF